MAPWEVFSTFKIFSFIILGLFWMREALGNMLTSIDKFSFWETASGLRYDNLWVACWPHIPNIGYMGVYWGYAAI